MSRSYKKNCAGTIAMCKSQKSGKTASHKKFRRKNKIYTTLQDVEKLNYKQTEFVNTWDLEGDGKTFYTFDKNSDIYKKWTRK